MDVTSPTVDRSQADGQTAARSQQQKAAAVQKQVAARKQLACAFPKLHAVAVNVQLSLVHGLLIRLTEDVMPVKKRIWPQCRRHGHGRHPPAYRRAKHKGLSSGEES